MKITDLRIIAFRTRADRFHHGVRYPNTELVQTLTCIDTDAGVTGYYLGGGAHGDQEGLKPDDREVLLGRLRSLIVGQDPFDRELIWKWLWVANIPEHIASVVDLGAVGTMPWPSQPRAFVQIWNAWQGGDTRTAREVHAREIVPLARLATTGIRLGHTIHKELLRRQGVIRRAEVRAPSDPLDELTTRELDEVCDQLGLAYAASR